MSRFGYPNRVIMPYCWYYHNLSSIFLSCKPLFLWFSIDFFCYLRQILCLKWSEKSAYHPNWKKNKLKTAFFQNRLWFSTPRQETDLWFQNMNMLYSSLPFIKDWWAEIYMFTSREHNYKLLKGDLNAPSFK